MNTDSVEGAGRSWSIEPPHCVSDGGDRTEQVEGGGLKLNGCARPSATSTLEPGPTLRPGAKMERSKVALRLEGGEVTKRRPHGTRSLAGMECKCGKE